MTGQAICLALALFLLCPYISGQWETCGALSSAIGSSLAASGPNIFAGTHGGAFLSTDNGTSWTAVGLRDTSVGALAVSGTNLFAVIPGGGVFRSTNNGTSWDSVSPINREVFGTQTNESISRPTNHRYNSVSIGIRSLRLHTIPSGFFSNLLDTF